MSPSKPPLPNVTELSGRVSVAPNQFFLAILYQFLLVSGVHLCICVHRCGYVYVSMCACAYGGHVLCWMSSLALSNFYNEKGLLLNLQLTIYVILLASSVSLDSQLAQLYMGSGDSSVVLTLEW